MLNLPESMRITQIFELNFGFKVQRKSPVFRLRELGEKLNFCQKCKVVRLPYSRNHTFFHHKPATSDRNNSVECPVLQSAYANKEPSLAHCAKNEAPSLECENQDFPLCHESKIASKHTENINLNQNCFQTH